MLDPLSADDFLGIGSGAASIAGYEYQIDVSVWLALDLVLANKLTQELVLEPASQEDIEADLTEYEPGRVTSTVKLDGYRLIVQAKLRTGDAWTVAGINTLLKHGEKRESAARRLAEPSARYLLVTSAALNGLIRKLGVRSAGVWPKPESMPASTESELPSGAAGRIAILGNQDEERLTSDIKRLVTERFRVPNARWVGCRHALREEARARIGGAGGGRWTRAQLEQLIRSHDGYIASSPELEQYVHPTNWECLLSAMRSRSGALIIGQSGTGKTMATRQLYEELRERIPGLVRVPITLGPQQLRDDRTVPPVLYDIEDPWGRFDFEPTSRPWNDQLSGFFSGARQDSMIVATSRLDVARSSGALESVKPWLVTLEAEHYGPAERRRLYRTRIDALPRKLQPIARVNEGKVLAELATPLEIQKFFDALPTLQAGEQKNPAAFVAQAIDQAHQNSIERTVIEQIMQRNDVRAAAIIWGLLKASDRISLRFLRQVEAALADHSNEFENGVTPLIGFFVAARNLRQVEDSVSYYHPRVEAGIERALAPNWLIVRKALRILINVLVSLDGPGESWGVAMSSRLIAGTGRVPDLKPSPAPGAQATIDVWLASNLAEGGESFMSDLELAAAAGSINSNVSETARFILHRPDPAFGTMHLWGAPKRDDGWYERLRADRAVKSVIETFVLKVLPNERDRFDKTFVFAVERLAGDLTAAFLTAASEAVHHGVTYTSEAIAEGALNDLPGFESIIDTAVDILTPSEADQIKSNDRCLAIENGEYSDDYAEHLSQNEDGYTAGEFVDAYVQRVRTTVGWRTIAQHRHFDLLRSSWFRALSKEDVPNVQEILGAFAAGHGTEDEGDLWHALTKVWHPQFEEALFTRLVNGHANRSVRVAAMTCFLSREPARLSLIANELISKHRDARLVELAMELGEAQNSSFRFKDEGRVEAAMNGTRALPDPYRNISVGALDLARGEPPRFSQDALEIIADLREPGENLRVFRLMVDPYFAMSVGEDVRWLLVNTANKDAAVEAINAAIRHEMNAEIHASLCSKFAHVVARALTAVGTPMAAPLPPRLLALAAAKGSPVRKALVELLDAKPHEGHLPTLLCLVKDKWSTSLTSYGEADNCVIAKAAATAIGKLGATSKDSAGELYQIAIDTGDPTLRYKLFSLLVQNADIDMQEILFDLAIAPGQMPVRRAAAQALMAGFEFLAPELIARISPAIVTTKIEPVAARLISLVAARGDTENILMIAQALATNSKRKVFLLLFIWLMRGRHQSTADQIERLLPASHPAVEWAKGGATEDVDEGMLEDLGDELSTDQVLQIMGRKKK